MHIWKHIYWISYTQLRSYILLPSSPPNSPKYLCRIKIAFGILSYMIYYFFTQKCVLCNNVRDYCWTALLEFTLGYRFMKDAYLEIGKELSHRNYFPRANVKRCETVSENIWSFLIVIMFSNCLFTLWRLLSFCYFMRFYLFIIWFFKIRFVWVCVFLWWFYKC